MFSRADCFFECGFTVLPKRFADVFRAALSELCFVLAGKLRLACSPVGTISSTFVDTPAIRHEVNCSDLQADDNDAGTALKEFLKLDGMNPRWAAALHAIGVYSSADLVNTSVYDIFKVRLCSKKWQI